MLPGWSRSALLLLLVASCGPRAEATRPAATSSSMTLAFCGDVFLHGQNIAAAWNDSLQAHEFDAVFSSLAPLLQPADYAVCWLGGEFSHSPPYRGYPLFRSPAALLPALKRAGFDVVLATNHIMDGGLPGLRERLRLLDSLGLLHPGEFSSPVARRLPLLLGRNGLRVALLSYTYGTNGLPVPEPWLVSLIDTTVMAADIRRAESLAADFVIVTLHQGEEYELMPSAEQVRTAGFLARQGVGLVVSSHPHVVQPAGLVEARLPEGTFHRMPVLTYSLGNCYCGQTFPDTRTGLLVRIELTKDSTGTRVRDASFTPTYIFRRENLSGRYRVLPIARTLADTSLQLTASERRELQSELDAIRTRVEDPALPFLCR